MMKDARFIRKLLLSVYILDKHKRMIYDRLVTKRDRGEYKY